MRGPSREMTKWLLRSLSWNREVILSVRWLTSNWSQYFKKKVGALRHLTEILSLCSSTFLTQAGLMIFSCHRAQGLVGLEMLPCPNNFSSPLKIALAISLGSLSHREDRQGLQAFRTAEHPRRMNASHTGGHSTRKVIRGSSWWSL